MDAKLWAEDFMRRFSGRREDIDEGLMIAWFANAIMRGYDEAMRRQAAALADERRRAMEEAAKVVQEYKLPTGESIAGDTMNRYLDGIAVDILAKAQAGPEEAP